MEAPGGSERVTGRNRLCPWMNIVELPTESAACG
jgi:hypothetical protein